jgi:NADH:ubiquinone oxidoreductase subunit E
MNMSNKIVLKICLGSSCYSRGNQRVLETVKQYLENKGLKDKVDFRGQLCSGNCAKGPVFKINDKMYYEVNESSIIKILDEYLADVTVK